MHIRDGRNDRIGPAELHGMGAFAPERGGIDHQCRRRAPFWPVVSQHQDVGANTVIAERVGVARHGELAALDASQAAALIAYEYRAGLFGVCDVRRRTTVAIPFEPAAEIEVVGPAGDGRPHRGLRPASRIG